MAACLQGSSGNYRLLSLSQDNLTEIAEFIVVTLLHSTDLNVSRTLKQLFLVLDSLSLQKYIVYTVFGFHVGVISLLDENRASLTLTVLDLYHLTQGQQGRSPQGYLGLSEQRTEAIS